MSKLRKTLTFVAGLAVASGLALAPQAEALTASQLSTILQAAGVEQPIIDAVLAAMGVVPSTPAITSAPAAPLTVGARSPEVTALQKFLIGQNFSIPDGATGYFGEQTRDAVAAYQTARGITPAAGYYGPITRGYVSNDLATVVPPTTTPSTPTPGLSGGAGDIQNVMTFTSGTDTRVPEGATRHVLGFEVEADNNSDLSLTSVRVQFTPSSGGTGSTRMDRYFSRVEIRKGGNVVGQADVNDLSRSATGNIHTGTIAISDSVVRAGERVRFTVALRGNNVIDSNDTRDWTPEVASIRFNDATGAILTWTPLNPGDVSRSGIETEKSSVQDAVNLQVSPNNPSSSQNLKVETNQRSEEYTVFAFRLRGLSGSGDVNVRSIPVRVTTTGGGSGDDVQDVIDDIKLQVGNTVYDNVTWAGAATDTATSTFAIDEGALVVSGNQTVDVRVIVRFKEATAGNTVGLSVLGSSVVAENNVGDPIALGGSATVSSQTHVLGVSGANVVKISDSATSIGDPAASIREISLVFDVTAVGADLTVSRTSFTNPAGVTYTVASSTPTLDVTDSPALSSNASLSGGVYTVFEGETRRFTLTVTVSDAGATGALWIELNSVGGTPVTNVETQSYTVVPEA